MEKGYKCFDENLQCRGFQFEIGETYIHNGRIELCQSGFHFCLKPQDVFNYYEFDSQNRVCIIEFDNDNVIHGGDKSVTGKITIVKELPCHRILELVNSGSENSGYGNSGNWNSGDWNSGDWNSGNRNSGDKNSGYKNSGDWNSGNRNSGDKNSGYGNSGNRNSGDKNSGYGNSGYRNSGNWNSGDRNSGNGNSGDWNSANYSSGIFCSESPKLVVFNTETDITMDEFLEDDSMQNVRNVLCNYELPITYWLEFDSMTEEQKERYAQSECCGGVLLERDYKEACAIWWESIPDDLKKEFVEWEYFDADVFEEITGIKVK